MILSECKIGDSVKIKINRNIAMVRILEKGRKGHKEDDYFRGQTGYGSKRFDVKVKPIGANARFVPENTKVIE